MTKPYRSRVDRRKHYRRLALKRRVGLLHRRLNHNFSIARVAEKLFPLSIYGDTE